MTRTRYRIFESEYPYFLTCTVVGWLPVFTRPESVAILLDSWRFLQKNHRLSLYGFVIMENHLHFIAHGEQLSEQIGDFKSFTARKIIDLLEEHKAQTILRQLQREKDPQRVDRPYQLWQEGSHPQQIASAEVMRQKLEYIHNNPVKRGYVDDPTHWRSSSARNYARLPALIEVVTDWG